MNVSPVSVNRVQNYKLQNTQVSFGKNNKTSDKPLESNTKKKVLIGAGVLAATVAAAAGLVLLAKNGKLGDSAKNFVNKIFKPKNVNVPNPVENLEPGDLRRVIYENGITIKKGIATKADGSKFTGTIEGNLKADKFTLEYEDGKIISSVSDNFTKTYSYNPGGALNDVKIERPGEMPHYYFTSEGALAERMHASNEDLAALGNGKASYVLRWEEPNHTIFQASGKFYQIPGVEGRDGIQLIVDKNTGKSIYRQNIVYVDGASKESTFEGKTRKQSFFDKDGKLLGVHNYENGDFEKYNEDGSVLVLEKALKNSGIDFHEKVFELLGL